MLIETDLHRKSLSGLRKYRHIFLILVEFLTFSILLVGIIFVIKIDVAIFENNLSEVSMTEALQSTLLLVSVIASALRAKLQIRSRGYFVAVATLFTCMFVRENDALLDLVYQGFWVVPAAVSAGFGSLCVYRYRDSIAEPFVRHFEERQTTFVFIGLLLLLVFSRLFGTGSLWQSVMQHGYNPSVKTVVQEGLELLSYLLIAYGTALPVAFRGIASNNNRSDASYSSCCNPSVENQ